MIRIQLGFILRSLKNDEYLTLDRTMGDGHARKDSD